MVDFSINCLNDAYTSLKPSIQIVIEGAESNMIVAVWFLSVGAGPLSDLKASVYIVIKLATEYRDNPFAPAKPPEV